VHSSEGVVAIDKEKTLQAAQRAVEKKKYDVAIDEYRKLALAEKNDPRWLLKIGDTQQKKGDYAAAIGTYDEVAKYYASQQFHLKAVAVYNSVRDLVARHAPQLASKYGHITVRLAELYEKLQLTSDAIATWDQVAERLIADGREGEAIDIFRRIVSLDASNPLAHLRLAEALSRHKDVEGAIVEFGATAEQLTAQGRVDDALKVYERLLHHKADPRYARPAAELYLQRNGPNDGLAAIAKINVCLRSDPKNVELIALLARGFVAIGQNDKAVTIYKECARLAAEQNKPELRKELVRKLQQLAPGDDQVRALANEVARGGAAPAPQQATTKREAPPPQQPAPAAPARARAPEPEPEPEEEEAELEVTDVEPDEDAGEVEFEEREAAEELSDFQAPPSKGKANRVAEVIANADAFRKVKLFGKALTTLRIGLELDPRSVPIRERVRDVLIESGQTDQAIAEMVTLAAILLEEGDAQGAYDNLAWILEAEPDHPEAAALMHQLQVATGQIAEEPAQAEPEAYDPQPDELDVVHPLVHPTHGSHAHAATAFDELDEPAVDDAPLPSFDHDLDDPLAAHEAEVQAHQRLDRTYEAPAAQHDDAEPEYAHDDAAAAEPVSYEQESAGGASAAEIEAALEEADFYAQQGVYETAIETVEEALRASPSNPLLHEKLRELREAAGVQAVARSQHPPALDDQAFDIAASLSSLDDLGPAPRATPSDQVDVEEVFQKFKLGVAAQIDERDSQTHYDLGIAYEQMMLFDDAIGEFLIAAKDPSRFALCHSMIGMINEKQGRLAEAAEAYKAGLHAEKLTRDEELALMYSLAQVFEQRKNRREAIYYLKRIVALDKSYRDARGWLTRLEAQEKPQPEPGSGARSKESIDDELDAAFDDVLGDKKRRA
jgi:tetratricopeptide (TPR) repeat protein